MKKNKMMRIASVLLVAVLLSTCVISGTFAKYVTSANSEDKARVAYWGFQNENEMNLTGLFADFYGTSVDSVDGADVIAPGTSGEATFAFAWDEQVSAYGTPVAVTGPEVAYTFEVAVEDTCDALIENNTNIVWSLDGAPMANWDALIAAIKALSGDASGKKEYAPNKLPDAFGDSSDTHTISWEWKIGASDAEDDAQNVKDTAMGNADVLGDLLDDVSIKITITATQVD